jgi:hypothetical protein
MTCYSIERDNIPAKRARQEAVRGYISPVVLANSLSRTALLRHNPARNPIWQGCGRLS